MRHHYNTEAEPTLLVLECEAPEDSKEASNFVRLGITCLVRDYVEPYGYMLGFKDEAALEGLGFVTEVWEELGTTDEKEAASKARNDYLGGEKPVTDRTVFAQETAIPLPDDGLVSRFMSIWQEQEAEMIRQRMEDAKRILESRESIDTVLS
jgi:hypothetical protein